MDLDLETFLTALYVIVDDLFTRAISPPDARLWRATGPDERLRGALPGSGGPVAQRRALEKRARHYALCAQTSGAFVPDRAAPRVPSTGACDACGARSS